MGGLSLFQLSNIKTKVRNLTGHKSTNDLSDAALLDYINRYYQLVFPLEVRPYELRTWFEFNTEAGEDEYDLTETNDATITAITTASNAAVTTAAAHGFSAGDSVHFDGVGGMTEINGLIGVIQTVGTTTTFTVDINSGAFTTFAAGTALNLAWTEKDYSFENSYMTLESPATIDGNNKLTIYLNAAEFYRSYDEDITAVTVADERTGDTNDGTAQTFTTSNYPIIEGSATVTDETETFSDDGAGTLTGDAGGTGTVIYTTGAIGVTFNASSSTAITVSYQFYPTGVPSSVLFYNETLIFRPIPQAVYAVKIASWTRPTALSNDTDYPMQEEWGPLIAYGAAKEIAEDYGDMETLQKTEHLYRKHKTNLNNKIHFQNVNQRSIPKF